MNIFILDLDPKIAASYHNDTHVNKMILETAQLLCTAHHICGHGAPYKKTHENHPCAIWARKSQANYKWLADLGLALCQEYTFRTGNEHKTQKIIEWASMPPSLPNLGLTPFALAMPDEHKFTDVVAAYRSYYATKIGYEMRGKFKYYKWSRRKPPDWYLSKTHLPISLFLGKYHESV